MRDNTEIREGAVEMAGNFRILIHRSDSCLHLKLTGNFDGSSAYEVLNILKSKDSGVSKVFIHTSGLKEIHPFGREVFLNDPDIKGRNSLHLIFTGERGAELAPEGSLFA